MKIAILVSAFPPKWLAGTEIATYNIAGHLAKRGHEVHVITSLDEGLPKENMEKGFYVHRIKTKEISVVGPLSFCIKSIFLIKKITPNILHSQSVLRTGLTCFVAKKLFNMPYVAYCRGSDIYTSWMFKNIISRLVLKNADAVIALTEDMKRRIKEIYNRDIFVIPNGIDLDRFKYLSKGRIRRRLEIKEGEKIIIFVGTLRPIKGVKYLIEAMRIIKDKNKNVKLFLLGDGKEREYLEKLVKELELENYVTFMGKIANEEVPEYMTVSDVFVLQSLSEGFPVVILEAMASGLPIIVTKVGGLPEIIKNSENGFLIEPENPEQIAEKALLILESNELRNKISQNNIEEARKYGWERVVGRLEEVYFNVLNSHK